MDYTLLNKQINSLFEKEADMVANMANMSALLFSELKDVNWVGFYLRKGHEMVLGPFQGKVACVRLPVGKGVCGTCAEKKTTIVVDNVHEFDGHIACDSASNSEMVIPVIKQDNVIAVLDIDSPVLNRFSPDDKKGLENILASFVNHTDFSTL
jgi:L-methionine (R)-S-oxide reductase